MKLCSSCHTGLLLSPERCPVCQTDLRALPNVEGDALVGMRVGDKYELVELLGEGAMGWVYRAVHVALDRSVAIKLLKTGGGKEPEQIARFEQEARTVSRLNHPHIVSVIDFGQTPGGLCYLVTEFVIGNSLATLLAEEGPLPLVRTVGLFHQILAAVEEAHSAQIVHRDLKPDNIVVTPLRNGEDFAKVLDFGIATLADEQNLGRPSEGGFAGTPGFMAPETIRDGVATARSDVYALGAILYEMLAGRAPFEHEWPMALLAMHLNDEPELLRQAAPERGLSLELEAIVARALAKDPADRFASVAELRAGLFEAVNALGRLELSCDRCTRPMDPETGLCGLHGPCSRPQRPPRSRPDPISRTMIHPATVTRDSLIAATLSGALCDRRADVEQLADFLLGEPQLLEVAGEPGMGRGLLLAGLGGAAESLGMRVLELAPDPRQALRPWYPLRQMVGALIGCGPEPASARTMLRQAESILSDAALVRGLAMLFGFPDPSAPEPGPERIGAIHVAVAGIIGATQRDALGTCLLVRRPLDYDRSSQGWVRALPRLMAKQRVKVAASTDGAWWEPGKYRAVLRTRGLDSDAIAAVLDRAALRADVDKAALGARMAHSSGGNALHAEQAALAYAEGGNVDLPLDRLLGWRVSKLPREAGELLRAVCALGAEVPLELVTQVVGEDVAALGVDLLLRRGLLVRGAERLVSPAHPMLRHVVLDAMAAAERTALHGRIVQALQGMGANVFLLAHHGFEAGLEQPALGWLMAAGDEACRWSDHETAGLVHYRRAEHVARWRLLLAEDDERYLELSLKMAEALLVAGHAKGAEVVLRGVLGSATRHPSVAELARRGLELLARGRAQ